MARQIDFTRGKLTKQLILFSLPLVMGELLQNLYNSVDAMVVGNFVGDTALAAVSVCETLSNLLVGFFNGMSVGVIIMVSRAFGRKQEEQLRRGIRVTFTFSAILGVVLSILGIFCTEFLIQLSEVPENTYAEAVTYLRIYLAGRLQYQRGDPAGDRGFYYAGADPSVYLLYQYCFGYLLGSSISVRGGWGQYSYSNCSVYFSEYNVPYNQ